MKQCWTFEGETEKLSTQKVALRCVVNRNVIGRTFPQFPLLPPSSQPLQESLLDSKTDSLEVKCSRSNLPYTFTFGVCEKRPSQPKTRKRNL